MDSLLPWASDLAALLEEKQRGNSSFKARQYAEAHATYSAALQSVAGRASLPPQLESVVCTLHANASAAALKLADWASACRHARAGLACSVVMQDAVQCFKLWTRLREALQARVAAGEALTDSELAEATYRAERLACILRPGVQEMIHGALVDLFSHTPRDVEGMRRFADMFGSLDCAGALPHADARDRLAQECGMTILWGACQLIMSNRAPQSPVAWLIGELLKKGATAGARYELKEKTPLMYVACGADETPGALEAAALLLRAGADVNAVDNDGWTALMVCLEPGPDNQPRKCTRMARLLVGAGADVSLMSAYKYETNMGGLNVVQHAAHAYRISGGQPHLLRLFKILLAAPSSAAALSQRSFLWGSTAWQTVFEYSLESGQPELPGLALLTDAMQEAGLSTEDDEKAVRLTRLLHSVRDAGADARRDISPHLWETAAAASLHERALLEATLRAAGLPGTLEAALKSDANPLLTLHAFVSSILPPVCYKTFARVKDIGAQDEGLLLSLRGPSLGNSETVRVSGSLRGDSLQRHFVWEGFREFQELVTNPIRHGLSFAVPNEEALATLLAHSPLLELGAGTGYWASLLRARGADVLAIDKLACCFDSLENPFHAAAVPGGQVQIGDGVAAAAAHPERALVLMYPFKEGGVQWDAAALAAYTGDTVIHVGALGWRQPGSERAACELVNDDLHFEAEAGDTTSPSFQEALRKGFALQQSVPLPRWPYGADTLTIWKRKAPGAAEPLSEAVCAEPAGCLCANCSAARGAGKLCALPSCGAAPLLACVCHPGKPGIAYCTTEHHAAHWAAHRAACKAARAALSA